MSIFQSRTIYVQGFMLIFFVVLVFRLGQLQLLNDGFRARAQRTSLKEEKINPPRGLIYDRNNKLLVYNKYQNDLYFTHNKLDQGMDKDLFCQILNISNSTFEAASNKNWASGRYSKNLPTLFLSKINDSSAAILREQLFRFPGFEIRQKSTRGYSRPSAAHVLGYINEVTQQQIDDNPQYEKGDYAGANGIERVYEEELKGKKGIEFKLRDNLGRYISSYEDGAMDRQAKDGLNLRLGLDIDLQQYGERLMQNKKGAIVAIEPSSGEVLAIISSPNYEPELLAISQSRGDDYSALLNDPNKPLFNRATMARYPPGSTTKPIFALIALQSGIIDHDQKTVCRGGYFYKNNRWGCHAGPGVHNVRDALRVSCNTFFFDSYVRMIESEGYSKPEIGLDKLARSLEEFGIGRKLSIDLPQESAGLNPDAAYYNKRYPNDAWRSTYILSNGIGQGELEITTLQMANLAAILANKGFYYPPHLVKHFMNSGRSIDELFKEKKYVDIDQRHFDVVLDGMEDAVRYGTAYGAYTAGIPICGKTGTSQNAKGADHSVFFGFAPRDNPKIAIAVYVENGGWGGTYAAPIGGLMMEKYITGEINPYKKYVEKRIENAKLLRDPALPAN